MKGGLAIYYGQCLSSRRKVRIFHGLGQVVEPCAFVSFRQEVVSSGQAVGDRCQLETHQVFEILLQVAFWRLHQRLKGDIPLVLEFSHFFLG